MEDEYNKTRKEREGYDIARKGDNKKIAHRITRRKLRARLDKETSKES